MTDSQAAPIPEISAPEAPGAEAAATQGSGPESPAAPATPGEAAGETTPALPAQPRFLVWAGRHGTLILALVCLALWLPGILSLPALDRDESRFIQSSRQMLDSGNFVDIRFGQVPRYKKPVGIYWLQAATTALASPVLKAGSEHTHAWTYRLPSLLGGLIAVWLTFWCASIISNGAGLVAGLLLAASLLMSAEASMGTTDAVLLASIMGMQGVLLRVYRAAKQGLAKVSNRLLLAGWAAMAAGILVKGPVAPGVALATIIALIAWDRDWKEKRWTWLAHTRPLRGLLLVLLITAPWLIAIALESHGAFFQQSLGGDFAAKVAGGQEGHGAPPGYYLLLAAITFWPAILFITPGVGFGLTRRADPMMRFLLAWAGAWWLVVEIVPTKLPNYVLPSFPPLAILAALWVLTPKEDAAASPAAETAPEPAAAPVARPDRLARVIRILPKIAVVQFLIGAALTAAPALLPNLYALATPNLAADPVLLCASILAALFSLAVLVIFLMGRRLLALIPMVLAALILVPALTALAGPKLDRLWISTRLAALVAKNHAPNDPPPILAGYEEPSLVFALGKDVDLTDGKGAAEQGAATGGLALVDDEERPQFLARLAEIEGAATPLDDLTGFNYSRGHDVHITLYRVAPLTPQPTPMPSSQAR